MWEIDIGCILVIAEGGGSVDVDAGLLFIMSFLEGGVIP